MLTGEEGETMRGDTMAKLFIAAILLVGLWSVGQSVLLALGH